MTLTRDTARLNAMVAMSRAIRGVLEPYGAHLSEIPTDVLRDAASIVEAFAADLHEELDRRD